MMIKKHIPNTITCCNLLCGCVSVLLALDQEFLLATGFILLAAVFDFFDGFTARKLGVSSPIGKDLDSLADLISFGMAPTTQLYVVLNEVAPQYALIVYLITAFSALRLARFNNDERQHESFIGLATPANALLLTGLCTSPLLYQFANAYGETALTVLIIALTAFSCYLLISPLPMFSLKKGKWPFAFVGVSALLTIGLWGLGYQLAGMALSIVLYILISAFIALSHR